MTLMGRSRCLIPAKKSHSFIYDTFVYLRLPWEQKRLGKSNDLYCFRVFSPFLLLITVLLFSLGFFFFWRDWMDDCFETETYNRMRQWSLHFGENVIQLWSRADIAEEHVVDLWSEIFLWDGVTLWQRTAKMVIVCVSYVSCVGLQRQNRSEISTRTLTDTSWKLCHTTLCSWLIPKSANLWFHRAHSSSTTATTTVSSYQSQTGVMKVQHAEQQAKTWWQQDAEQRQTGRRGEKRRCTGGRIYRSGPAESQWFILKTLVWATVWVCAAAVSV